MHKKGHIALGYDYVFRSRKCPHWERRTVSRQGKPWTLSGPRRVPPQIDIHKPSVARVYDAILGGKDNFPWDRAVAAEVIAAFPQAAESAILNRQVLERAVRYLHDQGVDQFLDLGSGLPTARNTHEIAQELNPRALVAYVDNDPIVLTHARAQPASGGRSCRRSGAAGCAAGMRSPPSSTASSWWSRASSSCPSAGRTGRAAIRSASAGRSLPAGGRARTRPKTA